MSFLEKLEASNKAADTSQLWKGTFREFLKLYETGKYPNAGVLSHRRVYNMIVNTGTSKEDHFGQERTKYPFFENELFGSEESIDDLMSYIHSASQKTETARRMLLLYGPVSSGKSSVLVALKRGLEAYSKTDQGALFAIANSKMHEDPFLLVPYELRKEFEEHYKVSIEGELSPETSYRLKHEHKGQFLDFPVERILISEALRVGIGTWLPSDTKSQDTSELLGSIDFSKIQEYGDEADPRAYNFNGELNVANRGIIEMVEALKADEKFLRVLLTATQEKSIKAPRFGLIAIDCFIALHSNETEFKTFMSEKKYEAYHDRMVIVKVPYNLSVKNEVKIYDKLLKNSEALTNMHIAPHTLDACAMFAVLSRISVPENSDLTPVKKMKLYDKQHVKGYKIEQVPDMKKKDTREGMYGISPRFVIDQIAASISSVRDGDRNYITALDVLRQLNKAIVNRDTFSKEEKTKYEALIETARKEWDDILRNDIQKAFFVSFEAEARNLCENYLDHIQALCSGEKPRDPVTGDEISLDEKLMDSIEEQIQISQSGKEDFRNEILRAVALASRREKKFDYTQHAQLREAIQKKLFEERKNVIRMTVSTRNPDKEELRRINDVVDRMVQHQGYSAEAANALLRYATAHLFDK